MTDSKTKTTSPDTRNDGHAYSFTADEHLAGSIEENSAKLGERKFAELGKLHDAEHKGQKRSGMLDAIDGEIKARGQAAETAFTAAQEAAEHNGRRIYSQDEYEKDTNALQGKVDTLTKELEAANAKLGKARPPKQAKVAQARKLEFDGETELAAAAGTVAFADTGGMTNPALPDLQFGKGDFTEQPNNGGLLLKREIRFDGSEPVTEIAAVYLLDGKGKPAGVARFHAPVTIGGGRQGHFPPGTLVFRGDVPPPSPEGTDFAETAKA